MGERRRCPFCSNFTEYCTCPPPPNVELEGFDIPDVPEHRTFVPDGVGMGAATIVNEEGAYQVMYLDVYMVPDVISSRFVVPRETMVALHDKMTELREEWHC